jgi:hypothetical protein
MSVKPLWQCRELNGDYQISAIVIDGNCVFRGCQQISKIALENAWYPELLIESAISAVNNLLYSSMERAK